MGGRRRVAPDSDGAPIPSRAGTGSEKKSAAAGKKLNSLWRLTGSVGSSRRRHQPVAQRRDGVAELRGSRSSSGSRSRASGILRSVKGTMRPSSIRGRTRRCQPRAMPWSSWQARSTTPRVLKRRPGSAPCGNPGSAQELVPAGPLGVGPSRRAGAEGRGCPPRRIPRAAGRTQGWRPDRSCRSSAEPRSRPARRRSRSGCAGRPRHAGTPGRRRRSGGRR